jgi:hypothetical protein
MRYTQHLGNTLGTLIVKVVHHQRQPKFLGQPADGLLKLMIAVPGLSAFNCLPPRQFLYMSFPAKKVDAKVLGHPQNPLLEPLVTTKLPYLNKTLQHRVLSDILSVVDVPENTQANPEHSPVMPLYKNSVCTFVATPACCYQDVI